jgi:DNA-binding response OmpR family regulator
MGMVGLKIFAKMNPDLVILDLMLPELDGFRVLRSLRQDGHATPVLLLTAKGEEADKVRGLRMGADDYVTKLFPDNYEALGQVVDVIQSSVGAFFGLLILLVVSTSKRR